MDLLKVQKGANYCDLTISSLSESNNDICIQNENHDQVSIETPSSSVSDPDRIISPDPDPYQEALIWIRVPKQIVINSHTNQPKLYKYNFFLKN